MTDVYIYIIKSKSSPECYIGSTKTPLKKTSTKCLCTILSEKFTYIIPNPSQEAKQFMVDEVCIVELLEVVPNKDSNMRVWFHILQHIQTCINTHLPIGLKGKIPNWKSNLVKDYRSIVDIPERNPHQKYNSQYRDDSLDLLPEKLRQSVLQREQNKTGIKIPTFQ